MDKAPLTKSPFTPCPDFELAPLTKLQRNLLLPKAGEPPTESQAKRFALVLSLAFNDLKALSWSYYQLQKGKPPDTEVSAYNGEWAGISGSLTRMANGVLFELANLIQANASILTWEPLKRVESMMPTASASAWRVLLDVALEKKTKKKLSLFLRECRNEFAFHYDNKGDVLMEGYRRYFGRPPGQPTSDHAYVSLGKNMEATRFYYADAAVVCILQSKMEKFSIGPDDTRHLAWSANSALQWVLGALLVYFEHGPKGLDDVHRRQRERRG